VIHAHEEDIQAIQSYPEAEFRAALRRILSNPALPTLVKTYFPELEFSAFVKMAEKIRTVNEFQGKVIARAIESMLIRCSDGVSFSGIENFRPNRKYLYLSSHRDIILDPALLTQRLYAIGYGAPKVCLGDNLLSGDFVIDLIKMNKGVTVKRKLSPRELLRWSHALSELIGRSVRGGEDSVWIAHREGRTKDGRDQTQPGVLKMLAMSGQGSLTERLSTLHVIPVAISYEFDPCDVYKARELYLTETLGTYSKASGEDRQSMMESIVDFKGRIHVAIGRELDEELRHAERFETRKEQFNWLAASVDAQLRGLIRMWPSNSVAADLLDGGEHFRDHYTGEQKKIFVERMERKLDSVASRSEAVLREGIRRKLLDAYAAPVLRLAEDKRSQSA
jgi:hypothetical protein